MGINTLYPWLQDDWQQLQSMRQQSRLPHAIMLMGTDGLGKNQLATLFSSALLCKTPTDDGFACDHCSDCQLIAATTHPDFHHIKVLDDKKQISVTQIRELVDVCTERPHQGGYRIALISPCEAMNPSAANALLKTLEEPGDNTLLILVANARHTLPATIRSRCQLLTISPPTEERGFDWLMQEHANEPHTVTLALRLSNLAPLQALNLLNSEQLHNRKILLGNMAKAAQGQLDPIKLAASINKQDTNSVIDWMYSLALDAKKISLSPVSDKLVNNDQLDLLQLLSSKSGKNVDNWIEQLVEAKRLLATSSNINPQLIVEDLMFRWIAIFR